MHNKKDIDYYTFEVAREDYKPDKNKLVWNVFYHNHNTQQIEVFNVFEHWYFCVRLLKIKNKFKTFESFAKEVRSILAYCFCSKCEYELIITSWPAYMKAENIDKLKEEKDTFIKKYGHCYNMNVRLNVS